MKVLKNHKENFCLCTTYLGSEENIQAFLKAFLFLVYLCLSTKRKPFTLWQEADCQFYNPAVGQASSTAPVTHFDELSIPRLREQPSERHGTH